MELGKREEGKIRPRVPRRQVWKCPSVEQDCRTGKEAGVVDDPDIRMRQNTLSPKNGVSEDTPSVPFRFFAVRCSFKIQHSIPNVLFSTPPPRRD